MKACDKGFDIFSMSQLVSKSKKTISLFKAIFNNIEISSFNLLSNTHLYVGTYINFLAEI